MASDEQIRQVLQQIWDPLSVGDNPNLADEYDSFIRRLRERLDDDTTTVEEVSRLLKLFEDELGSFNFDGQGRAAAAEALVAL